MDPSARMIVSPETGSVRISPRGSIGVTVPVNKRVLIQPSYLWETSKGNRDVHYVLLGLIVNTR